MSYVPISRVEVGKYYRMGGSGTYFKVIERTADWVKVYPSVTHTMMFPQLPVEEVPKILGLLRVGQ